MEKLHCDIVGDLLPLYVDGAASGESRRAVEAHVAECEACKAVLDRMEKPVRAAAGETAAPMGRVKREIRRKRHLGITLGVLAALLVAALGFLWLTSPVMLSARELSLGGEASVVEKEGNLYLRTLSPLVEGWEVEPTQDGTVFVTCWDTSWERLRTGLTNSDRPMAVIEIPLGPAAETERVYYFTGGTEDVLLYSVENVSGGVQTLPRLTMNYYLLMAFAGAALFGVLYLILRKKAAGRFLGSSALFFLSYIGAHFAVMGGRGETYFILRDFTGTLLAALLIFAGLLVGKRLITLKCKKA